jgi:hypothetical protein
MVVVLQAGGFICIMTESCHVQVDKLQGALYGRVVKLHAGWKAAVRLLDCQSLKVCCHYTTHDINQARAICHHMTNAVCCQPGKVTWQAKMLHLTR